MLSALCRDITHVRAEEFSDIRNYPTDMVVREVMLFGKDPETAAKSPMIDILGHGFMQSIDMVCAELGWTIDAEKTSKHEWAVATTDMDTPVGVIEKGTVAAQRFTWQGTVDGRPVMTVRVNWLMGSENLDPPWTLGEQRFEVEFEATPPVSCTFHGLHPPVIGENPEIGLIPPAEHCVERDPVRVRGRARHQDLPRPPAARGPCQGEVIDTSVRRRSALGGRGVRGRRSRVSLS